MNAYTDELERSFRGHHVQVHSGERTYEGYVRVFNFNEETVILHGATREGEDIGSVVISGYDTIERTSAPMLTDVPVSDIEESPYAVREYDDPKLASYVRTLRDRGALFTFPTARETNDGYELLGGHKRTVAARRAGFETIPVRLIDASDWEALRWFVDEHIPLDDGEYKDGSEKNRSWYSKGELRKTLNQMQAEWDDAQLRRIPQLKHWLDRFAEDADSTESPEEPDTVEETEERTPQTPE